VTAKIIEGKGDQLKVSQIPDDGTWPTGTTQYEKRNIAVHNPEWDPENCIQCGQCSLVCPHASIRMKIVPELKGAPKAFQSSMRSARTSRDSKFVIQVFTEDCCGCTLCVSVCPAKTKALQMIPNTEEHRQVQKKNVEYFLNLPEIDPAEINPATIKGSQLMRPLFEFSGACAGCGETPYIKLVTQLFGDRMLISPTPPAAPPSTAATCPPPRIASGRWSRPGLGQLPVRGQRRIRLGMRTTVNKLARPGVELLQEAACRKNSSPRKWRTSSSSATTSPAR
jgi:pyruvate-ferredoxin/flavodoxin oxidoreductase